MLDNTIVLEKIGFVFLGSLFLVGVFLLYYSIIFDPVVAIEHLLEKGVITDSNSMYDPEILKEVLHITGILFLSIGSIYVSYGLGRRSK